MKPIIKLPLIPIFALTINCESNSCNQLPETYSSYTEATSTVKSTQFKIKQSVNTSKSSWIKNASYYSCDGQVGYLIIKTNKGKEYIYADVPIEVWKEFKNASSFGKYYNSNIKGHYYFDLN